ncbi:MAG: 4'-phosphopantetheinyl transferase family protein [Actinomycetota bacterium]
MGNDTKRSEHGPATGIPHLAPAEVHVWRVNLKAPADLHRPLLSSDEQERADHFRFPEDRDHYTVARATLRKILAGYLGADARTLRFEYGAQGKPRLPVSEAIDLRFNLSHSRGRALIAVAVSREVGVDIECVRREVADEKIARRFFSPLEIGMLTALPAEEQAAAFFRCWTRKEAYLKARGDGIYYGLQHFTVSLGPEDSPALLANSLHPDEVARWSMQCVDVGREFAACVAAEGADWRLICLDAERLTEAEPEVMGSERRPRST